MHTATRSSSVPRQRFCRQPSAVDHFILYTRLWSLITEKTDGKGFRDGTTISFSRSEIEEAMRAQHVLDEDVTAAIEHTTIRGLLNKKMDGYHLSQNGLANYHAMLRRI